MTHSLLISVTGLDQVGVTRALFSAISGKTKVLDIEQVVVDGFLQLGALLEVENESDLIAVTDQVRAALAPLGLIVSSSSHAEGVANSHPTLRTRVSVMARNLDATMVAAIATAIRESQGNIERIERIASEPVTALQFKVANADLETLTRAVGMVSKLHGVDALVQKLDLYRRGRQLVVMDVDSTVIQNEVVELLAAHAGVEAEVKRITDAAMAGELDFEQSLRARVKLLAGLPESVFEDVYQSVKLTPGAKTLCAVLNKLGYEIALVSGGFTEVVAKIAADLNVSHFQANQLEINEGHLTGEVVGKVVDRAAKAEFLRNYAAEFKIPMNRTIAIGDGANDLDMMSAAGLGVAFNAKPIVQAAADATINVPYLDSVLYLLGITRAEIEQALAEDSAKN